MQEVKDLETKYETELKDQEIANQQQTIAEKELQKNIYLIFSISLVILVFISVWFFLQRQKYLKKLKNEEIANMRTEQELKELNAMMHGQEEERNRIASDLHDRLGARLSSIKLLFQNGADEQENKQRVLSFIDEAIKETREISHNLSTDMLSRFGIKTALQDTMRSINESDKLEAELSIMGVEERWPLEIERNVYYVLLELINNTLKHAEATHIMVQLSQLDDEINVFYEDNGKGFKISQEEYKGMGMRSIQARMSAVKGRIFVNSKPGEGLNAVITIPLKESQKVDDSEKQKAKEV
jgi:signal transduction histidine kinase